MWIAVACAASDLPNPLPPAIVTMNRRYPQLEPEAATADAAESAQRTRQRFESEPPSFPASARGTVGTWGLPAYLWSVPTLGLLTGFTARTRSTSMTTCPAPPLSMLVPQVTNGAAKILTITTSRSS